MKSPHQGQVDGHIISIRHDGSGVWCAFCPNMSSQGLTVLWTAQDPMRPPRQSKWDAISRHLGGPPVPARIEDAVEFLTAIAGVQAGLDLFAEQLWQHRKRT
jgi:hypothetical protein